MKIIEKAWHSFAEEVIPPTAHEVQRQECRRAFYAGAASVFGGLLDSVGNDDGPPTADEMAAMESVSRELEAWRVALVIGAA